MEHFGSVDSLLALTASISKMVSFTVDFVESAFGPAVLEESHLVHDIRGKLGSCKAFIEQRWKEIRKDVDGFQSAIECPTCQQPALEVEGGEVKCRFCFQTADPDEAANEYIARVLGYPSRYAIERDGGEWPLYRCPECYNQTLVVRTATDHSFCFNCGQEWGIEELARCYGCNEFFVADPDGVVICSDCFKARMEKD
jgi:ribosomal protein S27E